MIQPIPRELTCTGFVPLDRAARDLEVDLATIHQWIESNRLRAWRLGERVYVRPKDLEEFAELWLPGDSLGE